MEKLYFCFFWSVIQFFLECNPIFFSSVGVQTCANSLVSPELSSDLVIFMCELQSCWDKIFVVELTYSEMARAFFFFKLILKPV